MSKPPHPNTHLVEAVIKALQARQLQKRITVSLIASTFKLDHPNTSIPSDRTIASIKKRMETPEAPPSNLCKGCMGYGYLYEQTKTYFGDGTETPFLKDVMTGTYVEISCHSCENSGIDPNWERPRSTLQSLATPKTWETVKTYPGISEGVTITETTIESEPLEKTL